MLLPRSVAVFTFFLRSYLRDNARGARFRHFSVRLIAEDLSMFQQLHLLNLAHFLPYEIIMYFNNKQPKYEFPDFYCQSESCLCETHEFYSQH